MVDGEKRGFTTAHTKHTEGEGREEKVGGKRKRGGWAARFLLYQLLDSFFSLCALCALW